MTPERLESYKKELEAAIYENCDQHFIGGKAVESVINKAIEAHEAELLDKIERAITGMDKISEVSDIDYGYNTALDDVKSMIYKMMDGADANL